MCIFYFLTYDSTVCKRRTTYKWFRMMSEARLFEANIYFDNKMSKIEKNVLHQKKKKKKKQSYFQPFWCFGWILWKLISMLSCHMIAIRHSS